MNFSFSLLSQGGFFIFIFGIGSLDLDAGFPGRAETQLDRQTGRQAVFVT